MIEWLRTFAVCFVIVVPCGFVALDMMRPNGIRRLARSRSFAAALAVLAVAPVLASSWALAIAGGICFGVGCEISNWASHVMHRCMDEARNV